MAVYGYVRVSTSEQAAGGQSLAAQREKIALQARMMDKSVDRIFSDPGVSGSRPLDDRPGGKALLDAVKPGDSVIAVKLDRMFRSAGDALATLQTFKAKGAKLHLLDLGGDDCAGNGISGLVFTIMSAVAQFERERIAERIADAKAKDRADGRFLGGSRPFGWGKAEDGETMVRCRPSRPPSRRRRRCGKPAPACGPSPQPSRMAGTTCRTSPPASW